MDDGPERLRTDEVELRAELLLPGPVDSALALRGGGVIAWADGEMLRDGASLGDAPAALGAVETTEGSILFAAEGGWWLHDGDSLAVSPWTDVIPPGEVARAGGRLWIGASDGLWFTDSDDLFQVQIDAGPVPSPRFAVDEGGAWVHHDDRLVYVDPDAPGPIEAGEGGATGLVVDALGRAWWADGGLLRRSLPDGGWEAWEDDIPVDGGRSGGAATWWRWGDKLLHHDGVEFTELATTGDVVDVDPFGRALLIDDAGLHLAVAGRPLHWLGLDEGEELVLPTDFSLLLPPGDAPASLTVTLDETPVAHSDGAFSLDPLDLSDGVHELVATATWGDGEETTSSLFFNVGAFDPPTWTDDIEPLYDDFCTPCHDPAGGAHLLTSRATWEAEFDLILDQVTRGEMPLANATNPNVQPLGVQEIQLLRAWAAGGFAE